MFLLVCAYLQYKLLKYNKTVFWLHEKNRFSTQKKNSYFSTDSLKIALSRVCLLTLFTSIYCIWHAQFTNHKKNYLNARVELSLWWHLVSSHLSDDFFFWFFAHFSAISWSSFSFTFPRHQPGAERHFLEAILKEDKNCVISFSHKINVYWKIGCT